MYIEARLDNIEKLLGVALSILEGKGPQIAGAGADPAVAQQVEQAIAAAGGANGTETDAPAKRGRGRPSKTEAVQTEAASVQAPAQPDPFATEETAPAQPTKTIDEVRTALLVYTYHNDQPKALALLKSAGGVETLAALKPEKYDAVVLAALPAGKPGVNDVKAVLVAAEARAQGAGQGVLDKLGAKGADGKLSIKALKEEDYPKAIAAAHAAGR